MISKTVFAAILAGLFVVLFGSTAYGHFIRMTGDTDWGWGYGYGYGSGYGWEGGVYAGYRTGAAEDMGAGPDSFGWAYGLGYLLMNPDEGSSYDPIADRFEIAPWSLYLLAQAGLLVPMGGGETTNQVRFMHDVRVTATGDGSMLTVDIPKDTYLTAAENFDFSTLTASSNVLVEDLEGIDILRGAARFGLPELGLQISSPGITIRMTVGTELNNWQLPIYAKEPGGEWARLTSCVVAGGVCRFTTTHLSDFAAVDGAPVTGGRTEPAVTLAQPWGGESYAAGSSQQILWTTAGDVAAVKVSLSVDGGSSWSVLAAAASGGAHDWIVPSTASTIARIKLEGLVNGLPEVSAESSNFTITVPVSSGGGGGGGGGGTPPPSNEPPPTQPPALGWTAPLTRQVANQNLPPAYPVDALVKLADDGNPDTQADATVYYIGLDAKRHSFSNSQVYGTWYDGYSGVQIISAATLATIPLGAPVLVRPGTRWVKIVSDPKTYYVEPDGHKLRWIKDEATAAALGGPEWNKNIIDVDPTLFAYFTVSQPITFESLSTSWPAGALVHSTASATVWYTTASGKRMIMSDAAFRANKFQSRFVRTSDAAGWQALSPGTPISGFEDALFSGQFF